MASRGVPDLDDQLRLRLRRRFGREVESWLDGLPPVLSDLANRWGIEFDSLIQRGSVSVVIRCRTAQGRPTVLKASPDRRRIRNEAAALDGWKTAHVPAVLAVDHEAGALLMEAIEPGAPLAESVRYPSTDEISSLVKALHEDGAPGRRYPPVADRVAYLFESSRKLYAWKPELAELVSPDRYERSRELALRLASERSRALLLHGDLTPVNALDGGEDRGLVAIDPAPCLGDPAFDLVDLVLWQADGAESIVARSQELAPAVGADPGRLLDWCGAFAAMAALEIAESAGSDRAPLEPMLELASRI